MTLSNFRFRIKIFLASFIFVFYSLGIFALGRYANFQDLLKVKGVTSQNNEEDNSFEKPLPFADVQSGEIISSHVKLCSNTVYSFEIAYPKDWFTTYNTDNQKCTLFAPFTFVIPQNPEIDFVPIKLEVIESNQWQTTVKFYTNPNEFQNIISVKNFELNGKSVQKVESTSTDTGEIAKGLLRIVYLVFDSQNPLVLSYQELDEKEDVELNKKILQEMAESFRYF